MNRPVRTTDGALLTLTDDEINCLQDKLAERIGHCDEAECNRVMERIAQFERHKSTSHAFYDFEEAA